MLKSSCLWLFLIVGGANVSAFSKVVIVFLVFFFHWWLFSGQIFFIFLATIPLHKVNSQWKGMDDEERKFLGPIRLRPTSFTHSATITSPTSARKTTTANRSSINHDHHSTLWSSVLHCDWLLIAADQWHRSKPLTKVFLDPVYDLPGPPAVPDLPIIPDYQVGPCNWLLGSKYSLSLL